MPRVDFGSLGHRAHELADTLAMAARLTRDLPGLLRHPLSPDDARAALRRRLATRDQRFLALVERAVYGHPGSPYRQLLRQAGCELGDVRALVAHEGIEGALHVLADRGVYVAFDELKGRRDVVRGSQRLRFRPEDFDNPLSPPHLVMYTSGSGGRPGRVGYALPAMREQAADIALVLGAHAVSRPRVTFWWPAPLPHILMCGMLGVPVVGWFYPVHPLPMLAHLAARYLATVCFTAGYRTPLPRRADLERPERMLAWIVGQLQAGQAPVVWTMPSAAARLGIAARQTGQDLRGATFLVAGEPVTSARRLHIVESGARLIVRYGAVELTGMAHSCATPSAPDDAHLMLDRFAVTQRRRAASAGGPMVDATLVSGLSLASSTVALNVEPGDYARIERRDCDCQLGQLGLRTHLSEIRSFEKLTGEGVTFARSVLQRILEDVLPARFGGTAVDYQLAEEEGRDGATWLILRISPAVGELDEAAVRSALLDELARGSTLDRYQVGFWRSTGAVQVRREAPLTTHAGKVLPFQLLRAEARAPETV